MKRFAVYTAPKGPALRKHPAMYYGSFETYADALEVARAINFANQCGRLAAFVSLSRSVKQVNG